MCLQGQSSGGQWERVCLVTPRSCPESHITLMLEGTFETSGSHSLALITGETESAKGGDKPPSQQPFRISGPSQWDPLRSEARRPTSQTSEGGLKPCLHLFNLCIEHLLCLTEDCQFHLPPTLHPSSHKDCISLRRRSGTTATLTLASAPGHTGP